MGALEKVFEISDVVARRLAALMFLIHGLRFSLQVEDRLLTSLDVFDEDVEFRDDLLLPGQAFFGEFVLLN